MIWATVGLSLYDPPQLAAQLNAGTASLVVSEASKNLLGVWGGFFAVLGVIILPVTSGDTAFRSARLIIAEFIRLPQQAVAKRLAIAIPLFITGFVISRVDFSVIWRYFGWSNQSLAALVLWSAAVYLVRKNKPHWIASIPAVFLTAVSLTFIFYAEIGFSLPYRVAVITGLILTAIVVVVFVLWTSKHKVGKISC